MNDDDNVTHISPKQQPAQMPEPTEIEVEEQPFSLWRAFVGGLIIMLAAFILGAAAHTIYTLFMAGWNLYV